ncbi:hypothetical protein [Kocuria turfanensis]|nr:hypothetical protein [Kocuria turfanensis]
MVEHPGRSLTEVISMVEAGVPADRLREILAVIVVRPPSGTRLLGQLQADPGLLTSGTNAMPTLLQRVIAALLEAGATSVRLPRCAGCGLERMLPERLDGHRVCSTCKKRAGTRAIICHCCRRERQLASCVGDVDYCGTCWRGMYGQAPAIFVAAAHGLIPSLDPAVLAGIFAQLPAVPGRRLRLALEVADYGADWFAAPARGSALFGVLYDQLTHQAPELPPACCGHCGQHRPLTNVYEGLRCCSRCYTALRSQPCDGCGRTAPIARRMTDEARLCQGCAKALPDASDTCTQCGTHQHIVYRGPAGPVCAPCRLNAQMDTCTRCGQTRPCRFPGTPDAMCEKCRKRRETCSRCGQERVVATRDEHGAPICHSCHHILEPCSVCHRHRRVVGRVKGAPLCEYCYPRHPVSFRDCTRCGRHAKLKRTGLCDRCTADDQLATLFPPELLASNGSARTMLTDLQTGNPGTIRNAFHRHRAVELLRTVLATPELLDHEALDELGPEYTTRAVRALLVEHGLLPARNLPLARFQAWIPTAAQLIEDPGERQAFLQFATWKHLRDLRSRTEPLSGPLVTSRRRELRIVIELLAWARHRGKTLATLDQADLDHWATTGAERYLVGGFLTWAHINGRSQPLEITRPPRTYLLAGGLSDDHRRQVLDDVLEREAIGPGTKLAAALVLVFGIRPAQITRIRLCDIQSTGGTVEVTVGPEPLLLPVPLAELATGAAADRTARRMLAPARDHHWLYPGAQPGTPLSAAALVRRLAAAGVLVAPARTGALTTLSQQLPPPVLADLIGMHLATAVRWRSTVAASNAHYAGLLLAAEESPTAVLRTVLPSASSTAQP